MHSYLSSLLAETLQLNELEAAKWLAKDEPNCVNLYLVGQRYRHTY